MSASRQSTKSNYLFILGGYNLTNTARFWTYLTSIICNCDKNLDIDIPDNRYFLKYGPDYELSIQRRNVVDLNAEKDLETMFSRIKGNEM